ncbi:hypothetical protein Shyd_03130 [Streptomyces hydrogenans]|uniref:Uncharacterized protein n=1 Tax=Streptomyces hydrogenans TaxID=1873719 RepID=A0ABQ3P1P3_9ACTN|nr:hypothetical protein GCM10018784_09820 [Streptomyces hydrogenans]GHI18942.1 hypothetical protein Shyd_03130 [Streptomyces hydrogenans]
MATALFPSARRTGSEPARADGPAATAEAADRPAVAFGTVASADAAAGHRTPGAAFSSDFAVTSGGAAGPFGVVEAAGTSVTFCSSGSPRPPDAACAATGDSDAPEAISARASTESPERHVRDVCLESFRACRSGT